MHDKIRIYVDAFIALADAGCECCGRHTRCTLLRSESGRHWIWTQVCLRMEGACRIFTSHPLVVLGEAADENPHDPSACRANLSSNPVFQDKRWQQSDSTHFRVCRYYVIFLSIINFGCDASCIVAMYNISVSGWDHTWNNTLLTETGAHHEGPRK